MIKWRRKWMEKCVIINGPDDSLLWYNQFSNWPANTMQLQSKFQQTLSIFVEIEVNYKIHMEVSRIYLCNNVLKRIQGWWNGSNGKSLSVIPLVLRNFILTCLGVVFFISLCFRIHCVLCMLIIIVFIKFGNFSVIIS
jgi:hypothetical protein